MDRKRMVDAFNQIDTILHNLPENERKIVKYAVWQGHTNHIDIKSKINQ